MPSFVRFLTALDDAALVALLAARPDLSLPAPTSITSLAARATNRTSLERALSRVDAFTLQVVESVVALAPDDAPTLTALTRALGAPRAEVDAALGRARALALVWSSPGARHRRLLPSPGLATLFGPYPAGLAPRHATPTAPEHDGRPELADLTHAPTGAREVLGALTWGPPAGRAPAQGPAAAATEWLVDRGLLERAEPGIVVLPREVALELRGGRTHRAALTRPPRTPAAPRERASTDARALESIDVVLDRVSELVQAWTAQPPALLRTGGLGVREQRRAAARLGASEGATAFVIELAAAAGLVAPEVGDASTPGAVLAPSPGASAWQSGDVASRWAALAQAWIASARTPWLVGTRDARGALFTVLDPELTRPWAAALRASVLDVVAEVPGTAPDADEVLEVLRWRTPRAVPPLRAVAALLTEAEELGLLGDGAISTPGAALAAGADVGAALEAALPAPVDEIYLQSDLTGMVPGRPSPELARLIDDAAVVESRGGALTVRFSASSVLEALDAGADGADLLDRLRRHARGGVPQPLEYLIGDAVRRHGQARVGRAGAYVRVEDPALVATLLADPALRHLALREIAPTVVVSQSAPADVLDALRGRGLAPVAEGLDGRWAPRAWAASGPTPPSRPRPRRATSSPRSPTPGAPGSRSWWLAGAPPSWQAQPAQPVPRAGAVRLRRPAGAAHRRRCPSDSQPTR